MKSFILTSIILLLFLTGCSNENNSKEQGKVSKLSTDITITTTPTPIPSPKFHDEEIGTFTTNIYDKDKERQHNLELTCSKIDNYTVKARRNIFVL